MISTTEFTVQFSDLLQYYVKVLIATAYFNVSTCAAICCSRLRHAVNLDASWSSMRGYNMKQQLFISMATRFSLVIDNYYVQLLIPVQ